MHRSISKSVQFCTDFTFSVISVCSKQLNCDDSDVMTDTKTINLPGLGNDIIDNCDKTRMCSAENISDLLPHVCPNNEVDDEVR